MARTVVIGVVRRERELAGGLGADPPLRETVTLIVEHMLSEGMIPDPPGQAGRSAVLLPSESADPAQRHAANRPE